MITFGDAYVHQGRSQDSEYGGGGGELDSARNSRKAHENFRLGYAH